MLLIDNYFIISDLIIIVMETKCLYVLLKSVVFIYEQTNDADFVYPLKVSYSL